jgi:hypothetical protein
MRLVPCHWNVTNLICRTPLISFFLLMDTPYSRRNHWNNCWHSHLRQLIIEDGQDGVRVADDVLGFGAENKKKSYKSLAHDIFYVVVR